MIDGGWAYVWTAYAVAVVGLGAAALYAGLRLAHWAKAARALDQAKREPSR